MSQGWVYVLSNSAMPGLLKIGFTTLPVEERVSALSTTGVPGTFIVEFKCEVDHAALLERELHHALSDARLQAEREFFRCEVGTVVEAIKRLVDAPDAQYVVHAVGGASVHTQFSVKGGPASSQTAMAHEDGDNLPSTRRLGFATKFVEIVCPRCATKFSTTLIRYELRARCPTCYTSVAADVAW
ncbi:MULTISPECIES: GIY-YIG nuclease family protein [Paraburkholderia]|uniref:GIY-YIG nuclease family protein n=1 Tax=Paraburkholderia TaxID=1822464 RepID=UPI003B77D67F